jgi:hypothetical protein
MTAVPAWNGISHSRYPSLQIGTPYAESATNSETPAAQAHRCWSFQSTFFGILNVAAHGVALGEM